MVKRLGDVCTLKARIGWQGLTTAEYQQHGEYQLVTGTDFTKGKIEWNKCVFVSKNRFDQDRHIQVRIGDVLVTKDGTIGKVAIVGEHPFPTTLNSGIFLIRSTQSNLSNKFVGLSLFSEVFDKFLAQLSAGSTINHLYQKDFVNFTFSTPPTLEEQEAIANVLTDADNLIQSLEALIKKKRDIKQGAMQSLLTGKIRLPGFGNTEKFKHTEVGVIPEDWVVKRLGELVKTSRGASPRPIDSPIWFSNDGLVGWVRISDVTQSKRFLRNTTQRLSDDGIRQSRFVPSASLIMSICATVGRPIITLVDTCIHDGFVHFSNLENISQSFLYYVLAFIETSWSKAGQTGSQMNLNTTLINNRVVVLPPTLEEQEAIANVLTTMDEDIEKLESRLTKTQDIKQGMMQQLLTGQIRLI